MTPQDRTHENDMQQIASDISGFDGKEHKNPRIECYYDTSSPEQKVQAVQGYAISVWKISLSKPAAKEIIRFLDMESYLNPELKARSFQALSDRNRFKCSRYEDGFNDALCLFITAYRSGDWDNEVSKYESRVIKSDPIKSNLETCRRIFFEGKEDE